MKRLKISLIAAVALLLGIAGSAFTNQPVKKTSGVEWFVYNGSGSMTDPAHYTYIDGEDPGCTDSRDLCAIKVLNDGSNKPDEEALIDLYNNNYEFTTPVNGVVEFTTRP